MNSSSVASDRKIFFCSTKSSSLGTGPSSDFATFHQTRVQSLPRLVNNWFALNEAVETCLMCLWLMKMPTQYLRTMHYVILALIILQILLASHLVIWSFVTWSHDAVRVMLQVGFSRRSCKSTQQLFGRFAFHNVSLQLPSFEIIVETPNWLSLYIFLHLHDHLTAPYCFALVHYLWYFPWKNIVLIIVDPPGCLAGPTGVPEASYRRHRGRVRQSHPAPTICGVIPQIKLKISLAV